MEHRKDSKRRKDKHDEDDHYKERRYKRPRSRSQSPVRYWDDARRKRKSSRSRSPDGPVKQEKKGNDSRPAEPKKDVLERKAKDTDMLNTRTGGAYIPPARLRMMQAQITDKSSVAYQRLAWEALKKSIHGHINKINVGNIGIIIKELLKENIVRGRGLLCRSVIQAQAASPTFTNVYAALVAAVNSRFPNIGELLLKRLVIQFKRGFKRNDKPTCISSASFVAHLVNQRVAHEILALELLTLLVESPTDDSVEVAIAFLKECGQKLTEVSSKGVNAIFEMLRNILHEGQLDKRVQYMIEVMFQVWKDGFKDHPALIEELELVPEEEQFTHLLMLDDATDPQDILNVFKFDDKYEENEQKYKTLSKEILGSDAESGEEGSGESGSEESEEEEEAEVDQKGVTIIDNTETNLIALRRTIYLTINSSLDFEECAHKLMKMQLKPGQEVELCHMFLDCCAEQRTYEKFYGLLAQRFCNINRIYIGPFEEIFKDSYGTAHRLDTNRLRNVSKFFAHLLFTDSISWEVMECVKLNEEDTTSSSRIYIKILFQELAEYMGLKKLNDRLKDPTLQEAYSGIFPRDNPKNTRFSINFFTSIGLGGLTDELREHLKQMPKNVPAPVTEINVDSDLDSDSSSSSSSSSDDDSSDSSSSDSEEENKKKKKSKNDKSKEKEPKTPEEPETDKNKNVERWGHDGFYDTYGKDARRHDTRPERSERDKDNFAVPRDAPRRNENRDNRDRYENRDRNYDRRNNDRRRDDRNGYRDEDDRRSRDDRSNRGSNRDYRSNRDDRSSREDRSNRDDRSSREDRSIQEVRSDSTRDRDQGRREGDYQSRDRNEEGSRSRRDEREKEKRNTVDKRDEDDTRRGRDDSDRHRNENRRKDENQPKKRDDRSRRNDEEGSSEEETRNNKSKSIRDTNTNAEERVKNKNDARGKDVEHKSRKSQKKKNSSSEESSEDERNEKNRKSKRDSSSDDEDSKRKKKRKQKKKNDYSSEEDTKNKRHNKKNKEDSDDDSDSEEDLKKKKRGKDRNRREEDSDSRKKNRDDSDDEDPKQKKLKEKRKDKENSRAKNKEDDGWDIRGNSVRRELGSRYWE